MPGTCLLTADEALKEDRFSKGFYELLVGTWSIDFKLATTHGGRVRTRAAAAAACQAEGHVLAAVTSANWAEVVALVRANPDLN
ncbi:hypothetical protein AMAG_14090 [Allomyces macrogynus ATCC 38327]|uniref:Uncharacterized protein n=1 Tax=Allomyces macrogynus (strain ATCC 38327) TaxID=578462 RepID=A0A0L0T493_ALLM3|nr:hypothetical protein AMAG_14090 [Allomyces macrogynus ATCC 38327]|eukprot:KNE69526.1 hypothetical protein AMAG_14090 [Allomyces macrogynus ATCC 38327]